MHDPLKGVNISKITTDYLNSKMATGIRYQPSEFGIPEFDTDL